MERVVWLVGMMGAGKSAVGPLLADRLGCGFADSDAEVERRAGCSVAEIFDRDGEEAFRAHERAAIESLAARGGVVGLGGGAIAQPGAAARLAAVGRVVYLRARTETLLKRIGDARTRPLLRGLGDTQRRERLEALLADRGDAYGSAAIVVDTDELPPEEVADAVASRLGALDAPGGEGGQGAERPRDGKRSGPPERA